MRMKSKKKTTMTVADARTEVRRSMIRSRFMFDVAQLLEDYLPTSGGPPRRRVLVDGDFIDVDADLVEALAGELIVVATLETERRKRLLAAEVDSDGIEDPPKLDLVLQHGVARPVPEQGSPR